MSTYTEMKEELARMRKEEQKNADTAATKAENEKKWEERRRNSKLELDELRAKQTRPDEKGNPIPHWDDVMRHADQAINKELTSINDWRSAMISLLQMFSTLAKAIDGSLGAGIRHSAKTFLVNNMILPAKDAAFDRFPSFVKRKITGDPAIDMPALIHNVTFTEDNKLKIEPLIRGDNISDTGGLDALFKTGIHKWLEDKGYTLDPTDETKSKFVDSQNHPLTKAAFDDLKNDPQDGLTNYLKESSEDDLTFIPSGP